MAEAMLSSAASRLPGAGRGPVPQQAGQAVLCSGSGRRSKNASRYSFRASTPSKARVALTASPVSSAAAPGGPLGDRLAGGLFFSAPRSTSMAAQGNSRRMASACPTSMKCTRRVVLGSKGAAGGPCRTPERPALRRRGAAACGAQDPSPRATRATSVPRVLDLMGLDNTTLARRRGGPRSRRWTSRSCGRAGDTPAAASFSAWFRTSRRHFPEPRLLFRLFWAGPAH